MSKIWTKFTGLVVFGLLLATYSAAQAQEEWKRPRPTNLVVAGVNANELVRNSVGLEAALKTYGNVPTPSNLGDRIQKLRNAMPVVAGRRGLGGPFADAFLNVADETLDSGNYEPANTVVVSVTGQIDDYEFNHNGFGQGHGLLNVTTFIKSTRWLPNGNQNVKIEAYRWEITVSNFQVVVRCDLQLPRRNDCDDVGPFPETIDFTPVQVARIMSLNHTHKLWTTGSNITIDKIFHKPNLSAAWMELPNNASNAHLYNQDVNNCIDITFKSFPPGRLQASDEPPFYCLGRCANPLIVNTGW